jgi:hypothetical protein
MAVADGMEGGPDPGGVPGGGPDVRTGSYDGDGDNDTEDAGQPCEYGDLTPPAGSSTAGQPRPEDFL